MIQILISGFSQASEDPENREMLALMAASGEDAHTNDGESYIEKYTRGVSAVESILMLDRLRQVKFTGTCFISVPKFQKHCKNIIKLLSAIILQLFCAILNLFY